jgi:hypothetical protein
MHNNGSVQSWRSRDQDQVVVAKTKHAALLFSFSSNPKVSHTSLAIFVFQKETFWKFCKKKGRERTQLL